MVSFSDKIWKWAKKNKVNIMVSVGEESGVGDQGTAWGKFLRFWESSIAWPEYWLF